MCLPQKVKVLELPNINIKSIRSLQPSNLHMLSSLNLNNVNFAEDKPLVAEILAEFPNLREVKLVVNKRNQFLNNFNFRTV